MARGARLSDVEPAKRSRGALTPQSRQPLQNRSQVRLEVDNRRNRIIAHSLDSIDRRSDSELLRIERVVDFIPYQWHRDRRARKRPHTIGRNNRLAVSILQIIQIDLVVADEEFDLALGVLAPDRNRANPLRRKDRRVFLVE